MYGAVNSRAVLQLYQERFPRRCMPNHKVFQRLHRQPCENGSFIILDLADETLGTSTRAVACRLHVCQATICRVLLLDCWSLADIFYTESLIKYACC
ncbi:hypothetical protein TNCV_4730301 [Trichonephila clavipes]|nr:hypothetical protein TNCV_4730301 [Trichonephila clavipes]